MQDFATLPLSDLLAPHAYDCACGMRHATPLSFLRIGAGAVQSLPEALAAANVHKPFILCDENTRVAAWDRVAPVLEAADISYTLYTFPAAHLEPDEYAVGSLAMAFDPTCDVVLAIGSGVLNDCAKVLAHTARMPSMVVATAPSMDGYASDSSSMIVAGVKTTLYNACPIAVIADTDIVKSAPDRMLWAGFGDMIAKYVALCEWRVANLVTGEPYCENIAGLMRRSVRNIVDNAQGLMSRDPAAIDAIIEGLVLSGVAMSYMRNSRPASGLEHYFSHVWDMMALERGTHADLHGIQCGVGTLLSLGVLDQVHGLTPDRRTAERAAGRFDPAAWEANVRRVFGKTADRVIEIEAVAGKNTRARRMRQVDAILAHWPQIQTILTEELPAPEALDAVMQGLGMPRTPADLGVSPEDVQDAYTCSRDIRDKYLSSSMLWDLGLMDTIRP